MKNRMSQKKRNISKQVNKKPKAKQGLFSIKRRSLAKLGLAVMLVVPAYAAISAYNKSQLTQRDLGVIGQGLPTLVQVHDETCPKCRQLLSSVNAVIHEFPEMEFKIADLKSNDGMKFSVKHQVSKITLMYFDRSGKKVDVVAGLQSQDEVRSFLKRLNSS